MKDFLPVALGIVTGISAGYLLGADSLTVKQLEVTQAKAELRLKQEELDQCKSGTPMPYITGDYGDY